MTTKQFTLILDDERSKEEADLLSYLNSLGRSERQSQLRKMISFSRKLQTSNEDLFELAATVLSMKGLTKNGFEALIDVYSNFGQESRSPEKEPVIERREEPQAYREEQLEIVETPPQPQMGQTYMV